MVADLVAPVVCDWARAWEQIPCEWRDASLVLVPKVPRPLSPKNLRPIGLTESSGRACAKLLQLKLRPYATQYLQGIAQFAYLPNRDASMAIQRASQENLPQAEPNFVGIQLSLDMSSAFDLVDWRLLARSLSEAGVPQELSDQVMSWYHCITYSINHLGKQARVIAQQGLRQGCQLAPPVVGDGSRMYSQRNHGLPGLHSPCLATGQHDNLC